MEHSLRWTPSRTRAEPREKREERVHLMANNNQTLRDSAVQKLHEFIRLDYPRKLLWSACTTIGVQSRNPTWFDVRDTMP